MPVVEISDATYEGFGATCPECGRADRFSRASDFVGAPLLSRVCCRTCGVVFEVTGDICDHPYRLLLWDARALLRERKYTAAVLLAAQSFEVFFALFLRHDLVYRGQSVAMTRSCIDHLQRLAVALSDVTEKLAYAQMRNVFLHRVVSGRSPDSDAEAVDLIASLPRLTVEPPDSLLALHSNPHVSALLLDIKRCGVADLRNRSVHKAAYRPTEAEATEAVEEAARILFRLGVLLNVGYSPDPFGPGD